MRSRGAQLAEIAAERAAPHVLFGAAMRAFPFLLLFAACGRLEVKTDARVVDDEHPIRDALGCEACAPNELCVENFNTDSCDGPPTCVPRTIPDACVASAAACTEACQAAYCQAPFQCAVRGDCPHDPAAFTCYGP